MAIQIPNAGTGNGATGDNEFVLWTKVINNFTNTTHAASRLVGTESGNVLEYGAFGLSNVAPSVVVDEPLNPRSKTGFQKLGVFGTSAESRGGPIKTNNVSTVLVLPYLSNENAQLCITTGRNNTPNQMFFRGAAGDNPNGWSEVYHTSNTTKEPTTGYLKAASPILHLFNDDLVKEHEAVEQDITVEKLGTGDYLIKGSTGLSNEGWNLSPPKDIHGNVLCMVEATEADGNINVKTYKRKFDFDIVAIVPDYDQPLDIPDGHSVDLRLNDLPQETQTEV